VFFDIKGKKIGEYIVNAEQVKINVSELKKGFYMVQLHKQNGKSSVQKFIKQ